MFETIIAILPFIIPTSILKENLGTLILFLLGCIFIIKNKNKIKENRYFYTLFLMWILIIISQLIISPYIESISGSFLYLNMAIYYLVYGKIMKSKNKDEILKYILLSIVGLCLFYVIYQGLYQDIRVSGNFGYANSYAMLQLIGLYLNRIRGKDKFTYIIEIILFITLLFTGSRTTIILSLLYIIYKLYVEKKYNNIKLIYSMEPILLAAILYIILEKLRLISIFVVPLILIVYLLIKSLKFKDKIYYVLSILAIGGLLLSNSNTIERLKNISINNGTFQERLVYYEDSINSIVNNPLGNGINMFQYKLYKDSTAFYDVKYIHNSFLQVAYDVGVINFLIFISVIIIGLVKLFKSKNRHKNYLILAYLTILLHSLLDFDLSFSTFPIILSMLVALGEVKVLEDKKKKIKIEDNVNKVFKLSKYFYMIISIVSIYFMLFEASLVIGNYLIDINLNLTDNIFKFSNNISFNRDYRGYFNRSQIKKNMYDKSNDNKHLEEAINLLETSKEINPDNPMVVWNLAYLYEELGDDEEALNYWQEVLKSERFYPKVYIKNYDCLMRLYSRGVDRRYEEMINDLEAYYYDSYNKLNKRAKYMNNQLKENYDDIRNSIGN